MGLFSWAKPKTIYTTETKYVDWLQALGSNAFDDSYPETLSTLYTCVNVRSETLARIPVFLYKKDSKGNKVKMKDDPRYWVLHGAFNNYTTSSTGFATFETNRCFGGNSFGRIYRHKGTGTIESVDIVTSERIVKKNLKKSHLFYDVKKFESDEVEKDISASDMLDFKMLSTDGMNGLSPVRALTLNMSTNALALMTLKNLFANNAITGKYLENDLSPDMINDKEFVKIIDEWNTKNGGSLNQGRMKLGIPGTKAVDMGTSLVDSEIIETFKFNSNQIAALYQIPPFLAGDYTASKFASVEQLMLAFKASAVAAMTNTFRRELEFKFLTPYEISQGYSIEFNTNSLLEADFAAKAEAYQKNLQNGLITPRKVAEQEGFPTEGVSDEYWVTQNHFQKDQLIEKIDLGNKKTQAEIQKIMADIERIKSTIA